MALNKSVVGKVYEGEVYDVTGDAIRAYAEATGALSEWSSGWSKGGEVAMPLFAVRPLVTVLFGAIEDEEVGIDLKRLLHGEQRMEFLDVIKVGDRLEPRGEIESIVERGSGEVLTLAQSLWRDGEEVVRATSVLFVKGEESGKKAGKAKRHGEPVEEVVVAEGEVVVDEDQSVRYAQASGDMNPLHTDDAFAKKAGLPGKILQGLCTMAMSSNVAIRELCGGEIAGLKEMSVRFSRPVFMGDRLMVQVLKGEGDEHGLRVLNQEGKQVLSRGQVRTHFDQKNQTGQE